MSSTQPINKRKTEYTEKLSVDLSKHISTNPVGHIEIDLSLGMTSPFPSLSHASKSLCIPIVDPETVLDLVSEALPHLEKKEQNENVLQHNYSVQFVLPSLWIPISFTGGLLSKLNS